MRLPEGLEVLPLNALVKDIGADDEVETIGESVSAPVQLAGADSIGEGGAVELREQQRIGFEIAEQDMRTHGGGDGAGQSHAAAEVQSGCIGEFGGESLLQELADALRAVPQLGPVR